MKLQSFSILSEVLTATGNTHEPVLGNTIRSYEFPDNNNYYLQGTIVDIYEEEPGAQEVSFQVTLDCSSTVPWSRVGEIYTLQLHNHFEAIWEPGRVILVDPFDPWDNHNLFYDPFLKKEYNEATLGQFFQQYSDLDDCLSNTVFIPASRDFNNGTQVQCLLTDKRTHIKTACSMRFLSEALDHLLWDQHASRIFLTQQFWKSTSIPTTV